MPAIRIIITETIESDKTYMLDKKTSHYLCNVLRMNTSDIVHIFNSTDGEFQAEISCIHPKKTIITAKNNIRQPIPIHLIIQLAQVISRGSRMEYALQKATELGVSQVTPIQSNKAKVKLTKERMDKKVQHWREVIHSSVCQSGRIDIPTIDNIQTLDGFLQTCEEGIRIAAMPEQYNIEPQPIITTEPIKKIILLIGGESGFNDDEIKIIHEHGFTSWSLGPHILRTETAPVVALALLQARYGNLIGSMGSLT